MQTNTSSSLYYKAIAFMVSAHFSITLMNVFVKMTSDTMPASEILFFRLLIGWLFLLPFMIQDRDFKIEKSQWIFLVIRNLAGIASMLINFYIVAFLPLSITTLIINTSTLFIPILLLFLHQKTPLNVLACSLIGFAGVSIILLTNHNTDVDLLYVFIGLVGAVLSAMAFISLQELNKHNSPKNIVFYFHLIGVVLLPIFFIHQWKIPNLHEFSLLMLIGGSGLIFQLFLTRAFRNVLANVVSPFAFTGVIFSSIFDWLIWDNAPTFYFWIGATVIIASVMLLAKVRSKYH